MIFTPIQFVTISKDDIPQSLDYLLQRLRVQLLQVPVVVREFVDATSGNLIRYLPDGSKQPDKDYYFQKIDSTANTVTITAFGTQTIVGSATYVLASQYDRVYLIWNVTTQRWYLQ